MSLVDSVSQHIPQILPPFVFEPSLLPDSGAMRGCVDVTFDLRHAGRRDLSIGWESVGPIDAPVVFVAGGISATRHAIASATFADAGWWQAQVGVLDPQHLRIVAIDWLGADGSLDVPIDSADQADAIAAVLNVLAIDTLEAFVGCSYGAMVGLQFAARHGTRLRQLVAISGTHRTHPYASAWRALQRKVVALGQLQCDETHGLSLARQLAMLSYRTPEEFGARFDTEVSIEGGRARCAAEDYLDACGARFVERFDATAYLRLSESIDLHRVDTSQIRVPTTVVAVAQDQLIPVDDAYALIEHIRADTTLRVLHSRYGHDAFLKEHDAIAALLREALVDVCGVAA
ncbi:MAG: homoserine O-succinyltransferase [Lysobacter sp.]|nr:homoserine O-succinyltransferase [Lysobacter sp.]